MTDEQRKRMEARAETHERLSVRAATPIAREASREYAEDIRDTLDEIDTLRRERDALK